MLRVPRAGAREGVCSFGCNGNTVSQLLRLWLLLECGRKHVCIKNGCSWFICEGSNLVVKGLGVRIAGSIALESGQLENLLKSHTTRCSAQERTRENA
jgi:hypothetical protein